MNYFVELTAAIDMLTDMNVIHQLSKKHPAWLTITLLTIVTPFLISYTPLVNFQINGFKQKARIKRKELAQIKDEEKRKEMIQKDKKEDSYLIRNIISFLCCTPLMILVLVFMDLLYIVQSIFLLPIIMVLLMIFCCTCIERIAFWRCCRGNKYKVDGNNDNEEEDDDNEGATNWLEEYIYMKIFQMNREEILGFRRLRTISQLLFETIPSLILQGRMYQFFL